MKKTDEKKILLVAKMLAIGLKLPLISSLTGIPKRTISSWLYYKEYKEVILEKVEAEKKRITKQMIFEMFKKL